MPRGARTESESGFYHVIARGVNHCTIFLNREDGLRFLETLDRLSAKFSVRIDAWCLMGNHYHLLVNGNLLNIASMMKGVNMSYALYFNKRYDRDGHLFQGRYKSIPVESNEYYLTVLRYIHQNPEKAKICRTCDYPWSSYRSYVRGTGLAHTQFALSLLGGVDSFVEFHKRSACDTLNPTTEESVRALAVSLLGGMDPGAIAHLEKSERDHAVAVLKSSHLTTRQIESVTGISRSLISKIG